jgi:gamma-glutamyltranspeptidase / glutathione hydrolase
MLNSKPFQSRPMAMGWHGAVAAPHILASKTAIDVLEAGGNAVDAAVAAAAVSTVVQPFSSSVGGVGWATVYDRSTGKTGVLQFSGATPEALDPGVFRPDPSGTVDWRQLEGQGGALLGSLVPGAVAGWEELLARKGRWSLAQALEGAVALASEGYPVSELLHEVIALSATRLRRWPTSAAVFLPENRPLQAGERLVQADLAATLQRISRNGAAEMVSGETGEDLVRFYHDNGGALSATDLARYRPTWHEPLVTTYRGNTVHATPAPLGDVSFACGLQLLDAYSTFTGQFDPEYVHVSVESAKLISAERARYLGAEVERAVAERLLAADHVGELKAKIRPSASSDRVTARSSEDTITLAVVDEEGNAVHLMQTVGTLFGTGAVLGRTGVLGNSSLYFAYAGGNGANRVIPGRGIEQNPCLASVFDPEGNLRLIVGSPGGRTRVETVRQMLVNVIDFGMNLQQAVDAPRFLASSDGVFVDFENRYGGIDPHLAAALHARGHQVRGAEEVFGSGQAVGIDRASGARMAAADWRRESAALAY